MKRNEEVIGKDVFGVLWGWDLENSGHEVIVKNLNKILGYLSNKRKKPKKKKLKKNKIKF